MEAGFKLSRRQMVLPAELTCSVTLFKWIFFPVYDLLFVLLHFKAVFYNFRQLLELSSSGPCMLYLIK